MNLACMLFVLGASIFVEQNVPGLRAGPTDPLTGRAATNFRHGDFDGDGHTDLLLPDRVVLQREGRFPENESRPLPKIALNPACDFFGETIYLRTQNALDAYQLKPEGWRHVHSQEIVWPRTGSGETVDEDAAPGVRFERFLHDLNGDGVPEILLPSEKGLHVFGRSGDRFEEAGVLDIYPQPVLAGTRSHQALWPPAARTVQWPSRKTVCQFFVDGTQVTVVGRRHVGDGQVRYRVARYRAVYDGTVSVEPPEIRETAILPAHLQACRLNEDDTVDFAGGDWHLSAVSPLPTPVFETTATLDWGETLQRVRTATFRPHCLFVDFDGDGDLDLAAEATGLLDGGIREAASRFFSEPRLRHEIQIYLQDALGRFSSEPDLRRRFTIRLDSAPYKSPRLFARYKAGELLNITGDFNGDGYRDAAVQVEPQRLAIFLYQRNRFSRMPDMTLRIEAGWRFSVVDVDADGRSDIVVEWHRGDGADRVEESRVFFSREQGP